MNLSEVSIKNPVFAWMLMFGLMFFGFLSFRQMGVGFMPDIDFPVLNIDVEWEGAAPEVMESDVVDVLEDAVMSVEGVRNISSSTRQGRTSITLEFDLNRDIDVALQEVQSKISEAQKSLPNDIDPAIITKSNPEDHPILWLAVTSSKSRRDLMEFVDKYVKDRFKTVPGVGDIFLGGYVDRNLRVWLDVNKLEAYQLTVEDIIDAIQGEHVETPAGRLETAKSESNVRAMGEARSVEEFETIVITQRGGQPIYKPIKLKDVAYIEDGLADVRRISRVMGEGSVGLGIRKQRGANSVAVAHDVKKRVVELQKELPPEYKLAVNFDSTRFIEDNVHELIFVLITSAMLTSMVCWMFLGSFSSTFNVLLAIPTSILGTFIVLQFAGFTLNTFSILGLTLAIGIVVDDAIMVLENIVRLREKGVPKVEAALAGSKEISFAALASTIAIIAIFLPVAYMKGIIGKFFFEFAVTISVAVAISLLEALTLTPMRCSQFLEVGPRKTIFGKLFEKGMNGLTAGYQNALGFTLKYKKTVLILSVVFFALSLLIVPKLRKEFVPAQDQSMFLVRFQTPIGSSLDYTDQKVKLAEEVIMKIPEVSRYYSAVGGFGGGEVNAGQMFVTLKLKKARPIDPLKKRALSQMEVMNKTREELKKIPDLKVVIQDLSTRGFAAQRGFPIEFTVRGPDWDKLSLYADGIRAEMAKTDLYQDIDTDYLSGMTEVQVTPNRQEAFERGVSISSITRAINALVGGERIAKYTKDGRRYDVRLQMIAEQRKNPEDIRKLMVWNNRGEMVRLRDLVEINNKSTLLAITRQNRERAIGIFANVATGKSQSDAINMARTIAGQILPADYRIVFSGTSQTSRESFQSLIFALVLGILIAYMVLAAQFNHLVHPITVLLALPFSVSGAFLGLYLTNQSLNIFSLIGLLLLMGIVKKNSIMLVEFTNQMRERGMNVVDALKTACPIRLRPIIMTSVSTVAAALPACLALGPGSETRVPMAIAVVGGVIVSTFLTLFVVPAAYLVFTHLEKHELLAKWRK